jgi:hypothetical protein
MPRLPSLAPLEDDTAQSAEFCAPTMISARSQRDMRDDIVTGDPV